jgi:dual specificity MAP kinase phosphatase
MSMHGVSLGAVSHRPSSTHFIPGKGPGGHGSLWIEEREGRIKVLDIKGVCDDGIDTLEPQLEPICDWIDKARLEGGQVLVHCRVGVSRSATVTVRSFFFPIHFCDSTLMAIEDCLCDEAPWTAAG